MLVLTMRDMLAGKVRSTLLNRSYVLFRFPRRHQDTRRPQAEDPLAPRAPLITAEHSKIDFKTMTASRIVGTHRAISHQKPMTTVLKTERTLQLHDPRVLTDPPSALQEELPVGGTATYHPPSSALIVRCAEDTYLSVPKVRHVFCLCILC